MTARHDPFAAYNFIVAIDGIATAGFSEVSGLVVEIEAVDYREGNDPTGAVRKLPGRVKYSNITLKRGSTADLSLWQWVKSVLDGQVIRVHAQTGQQRRPDPAMDGRQDFVEAVFRLHQLA